MLRYSMFQFRKVQLIRSRPSVNSSRVPVSIPQGPINTLFCGRTGYSITVSIPQGPINTMLYALNLVFM